MKAKSYLNLISRLNSLRAYYTRIRLYYGIFVIISLISASLIFSIILSSLSGFILPVFVRVVIWGIFFLALSIIISYFFFRPLLYKPTLEDLAIKIENKYPQLKNRLIGALQLYRHLKKNPEGYSVQMIEKIIEQADTVSTELNFKEVVNKKPLGKASGICFALLCLTLISTFLFSSHINRSLYLFSHPLTQIEEPQKFFFDIWPGDAEVLKSSDVRIKIKTLGEKPKRATFYWRNESGDWNEERLDSVKDQLEIQSGTEQDYDFEYIFNQVKRNIFYYVKADGIKSREYRLIVVDRPRIVNLKLYFNYPQYTRLKPQVLDLNDGNIEALAGTKVKIEAETNKELAEGRLIFSDSSKKEMKVENRKAICEILVKRDDTYYIEVIDRSGNINPNPIEYKISVRNDLFPGVQIIQPAKDLDLTEDMQVPLLVKGSDDFGFTHLKLLYEFLTKKEDVKSLEVPYEQGLTGELHSDYLWSLSDIGIMPGDAIKYWVELYDNDVFSGPKKGVSSSYNLRHPTLEEIIGEIEEQSEQELANLEQNISEQKELQKKLNELSKELFMQSTNSEKKTGELSWEKKKELESLLQKQKDLAEKLKQLGDEVGNTCARMEENNLTSLEIMEKIAEMRKLFEEVAPPELKEAMRKLQQALEELDREKVQEALQNLNLTAEELLKKLERTIALLKRMQIEQRMENLVKLTENLTQMQKKINQKIEKVKKEELSPLSEEEQELQSKTEDLEKNLTELNDLMRTTPLLSPEELEKLLSSIDESGIQEDLEKTIQSLKQGKRSESLKSGKVCEITLNKLSQDFKLILEKMRQGDKEKILADMRKSLHDLLYLSSSQERLFEETKAYKPREVGLREIATEEQKLVEGLNQVGKDLKELSHKSFHMGPDLGINVVLAYSNMLQATAKLEQMDGNRSLSFQFESLYNLNQAAKSLLESMENVEKSCSGNSDELSQKLESFCQKQKGINTQTLELSDLGQYSIEQQTGMARLAAEQEVLRKSLEDLNQELGNRSQILGSLEDIAKEMEKVVADLEKLDVNRNTIERQKKIYSRLLDSEKSLTRRDYSQRRKAELGEDIFRKSPPRFSPDTGALSQKEKERTQRLSSETFPREYEEAIKKYFKALSEHERK